MPRKKRMAFGQAKAKKMKQQRANETPIERARRLENQRLRSIIRRALETKQQREDRLKVDRERAKKSRASMTAEQREARLKVERERARTTRASETPEQREDRLRRGRNRAIISRASKQREDRLTVLRNRASTSRATEIELQHNERLQTYMQGMTTIADQSNLMLEGYNYDPNRNYTQHSSSMIGPMDHLCSHCKAKKIKSEPPDYVRED